MGIYDRYESQVEDVERTRDIVDKRAAGWTWNAIADIHGISRQRVKDVYDRAMRRKESTND